MPLVWALNVILNLYFGVLSNDSLYLEVENFNNYYELDRSRITKWFHFYSLNSRVDDNALWA